MKDLEMGFKIAAARADTQLKMREQYLDGLKNIFKTFKPEDLDLMTLLSDAYNRGAVDCLTIMMVSDEALLDQEGGDQDEC